MGALRPVDSCRGVANLRRNALAFTIHNSGSHVITSIEAIPYPSVGTGCIVTPKLGSYGVELTISYNCTPPANNPTQPIDLDMIVVFYVDDPTAPGEEFSPPMLHWATTITYSGTPTPSSPDVLIWILVGAGALVVIVIIVVFATRLANRREKETSFEVCTIVQWHNSAFGAMLLLLCCE